VRELIVPPLREVAPEANLSGLIVDNAIKSPHNVAFRRRAGARWEDVTARDFLAEVNALAKGLIASGVQVGERVAIMSRTRYEWTLADFAIWSAGGVVVPIYETSSAEQVQWILGDSGSVAVFVETDKHEGIVEDVLGDLPGLKHIWNLDGGVIESLVTLGTDVPDGEIEARRKAVAAKDLATIIYTSGTTGRPKGCMLTHGNFLHDSYNAVGALGQVFEADSSTLMFLPLAHVFGRIIQISCVYNGVTMGHSPDIKNLLDDLGEFQPSFILSVPRVFEKVYNGAQAKAAGEGKGAIFDRAADVAIRYSTALDTGGPSLGLRLQHALFDKLVYSKLRARLGGRCAWGVSGGAALGSRLGHFFRGIGLTVLEGYGLTETSAATSVGTPTQFKVGTVGRPLPGTGVRIAADGEIMLSGAHIFQGYWNNEAATAEAIEGGWFHTGDIGEIDDDGFIKITGRKKEIIVTAGGKNVAPAVLEDRLRAHTLISQCMVVGDGKPFIGCLVTLDPESLPIWLGIHGKPADLTPAQAAEDHDVIAEIQRSVDEANKAVSHAEAIKKFKILTVDFTEDTGHLTPSMKLKRNIVLKDFGNEVEALYG